MIFTPLPVANYAQILAAEAEAAKMRPYAPVRFACPPEASLLTLTARMG